MTQDLATIVLNPKKTRSLERFHPWVFSGAIQSIQGTPDDGDFVRVIDAKNTEFGYGLYSPNGSISVRMTHFKDDHPSERWWHDRILSAYKYRESIGLTDRMDTNAYRLVHGEGDLMPGLIIDHYNGLFVVQAHTSGFHRLLPQIAESIAEIYGDRCKAVYNKSGDTLPGGCEEGYLIGSPLDDHTASEYGNTFAIDHKGGQKTGFFIDQRENRRLLGEYSKGKRVLNTFSYTAGFSVYALQNDAALVHSLDSSKRALELGDRNVAMNSGAEAKHESIQADAVQYLKELGHTYDIVVLDPPAFAKHLKARHKAVQGYKRINYHAIKQIAPGGLLFTFSCSQAVERELFTNTVIAAAIEAGRRARIIHRLDQPADHPVSAFHPEGEYLKGLVLQLD